MFVAVCTKWITFFRPPAAICWPHHLYAWHARRTCRVECLGFTLHTPKFPLQNVYFTNLPSTLFRVQCTFHTWNFTLFSLHIYMLHLPLHIPRFKLCTPPSTLYPPHFRLYTPHSAPYPVHSIYVLQFTHYALRSISHFTLLIPQSSPYTPHSALKIQLFTLHTLHFTLRTLQFTLYPLPFKPPVHCTHHTL